MLPTTSISCTVVTKMSTVSYTKLGNNAFGRTLRTRRCKRVKLHEHPITSKLTHRFCIVYLLYGLKL